MSDLVNDQVISQGLTFLSRHHVFFGHQSVGGNILTGLENWMQESDVDLRLIHPFDTDSLATIGITEEKIGQNGAPLIKLEDFQQKCLLLKDQNLDIAIMKFCYIDFTSNTDLEPIKKRYIETFHNLEQAMSDCRFIHMTVPYTALRYGLRSGLRKLLGQPISLEQDNIIRNHFNDFLRTQYPEQQIFDLGKLESTTPSGNEVGFSYKGKSYQSLFNQYTDDWGHLNALGKRWVSAKLLDFFAKMVLPEG